MSVKQEQNETTQMIKKQKHSYPPQWFCQKGHRVDKFCTNKDCRFDAFCCRDEDCFTCTTNHQDCFFGEFNQLIKRIDTRLSFENRTKMAFLATEEQILKDLQASRREVLQKKYFWGENPVSTRINELFFKGIKFELNGAEMNEIFTELSMKGYEEKAEECLQKFQKEINSLKSGINDARSKYLDAILSLGKKEETKEASESCDEGQEFCLKKQQIGMVSLSSDLKSNETVAIGIDSQILQSNPERDSMISFIMQQLENPSHLKLLFRASQHNYRSQAFHKACNNIENTFTIIHTEYDKIIAGFTPLEWTSHGYYTPDPSSGSFLLHLNLRERMNLKNNKKATYDHQHKGPCFGVGDILIEDKCNINADSSTNFPNSYLGVQKYRKEHQSSWTMFSGAPIGRKFIVVEYEVFQVIK